MRRSLYVSSILAAVLLVASCKASAPSQASGRLSTTSMRAGAKFTDSYRLTGNTRVETALELTQETSTGASISYATEAQVLNAIETANASVMLAVGAEAKALEALNKSIEVEAIARDAAAKATGSDSALAVAQLAKAAADTATAQAAAAEARANTAAQQASMVEATAQTALQRASAAGDAAAQASAAAALAEAKATTASSQAALAQTRADAAKAQSDSAATAAQQASAAAATASTQASAAIDAANLAQTAINVKSYGAKGDGVSDDSAAILAAIKDCAQSNRGAVYFPPGTYMVSRGIPYSVPFFGISSNSTKIKALNTWADSPAAGMVDFNNPVLRKFIKGLTFDASHVPGLKIFGSSSVGTAGGSSLSQFSDLTFNNSADNVYAVGGSSTVGEVGMLTGAVFMNCNWNGCRQWIEIGNNQDDTTLIGCRFALEYAPSNPVLLCAGNNANINSCYFRIGATNADLKGVKALAQIGTKTCRISGCFFEGTSNLTHFFFLPGPTANFILENAWFSLTTCPNLIALVRSQVNSTTQSTTTIDLRNVRIAGVTIPAFDIFHSPVTNQFITLRFAGINTFSNVMQWGLGSSGADNPEGDVRLFGEFKGKAYGDAARFAHSTGNLPNRLIPVAANGRAGLTTAEGTVQAAAASSPSGASFILPSQGIWEVTVVGKVNGDANYMVVGAYRVGHSSLPGMSFCDSVTPVRAVTGAAVGTLGLAMAAPDASGKVTATISWTGGGSYPSTFHFTARKLSGFGDAWTN